MASLTTNPRDLRKLPTRSRKLPTRSQAMLFGAKAWCLRAKRWTADLRSDVRRWPQGPASEPEWFRHHESRTPLRCETDPREREMEEGKVANLRLACSRLDGAVVEAEGVFSFWRQLGRAARRRGFVQGRMLQQGCMIPAVGGGLCQLSNALYVLALRSGCEIVERHPHSARLPNMPVHDATVAWNYIDLRFRVHEDTRIRASLTEQELVVALEGTEASALKVPRLQTVTTSTPVAAANVHYCGSCGETTCFRHRDNFG